ncbi:monocarboxylate transporter 13 isoform A [Alligator mississippiensis]|uniref:Monocarboxylate transporter 13 n=1 Tax=Alligator mississippiensis TaxID=8496 RepID=A0A151MP00_ALLMI|nr:monocarboxylate transporter 13 isoform A [Alligator mississippiensis]
MCSHTCAHVKTYSPPPPRTVIGGAMTVGGLAPPDGGWGWAVVLAGFVQAALVFGVLRSFGVFFVAFVVHFGEPAGAVSWVPAIAVAVQQFASPVGSILSAWLGPRPIVMAGGILASLGLILASFATSLIQLYLTIGLLTGLGWALVFTPTMATVARYFRRRRTFATSLALSGAGLSAFAFSPLFQLLAEAYGWRGALLLVGGLSLHLVACGALLRPLALPAEPSPAPVGLALLRHIPFVAFTAAVTLVNTGYFVPYVHLVARARELGLGEYQAATVLSAMAVADLAGRLASGAVADTRSCGLLRLLAAWTALAGVALTLVPLGTSYPVLGVLAAAYGFFAGALTPVVFSLLPQLVGVGQIYGALGLLQMLESGGGLLGAPLAAPPPHVGWAWSQPGPHSCLDTLMGGAEVLAPPDGGWGWAVVLAGFLQAALVFGVLRSFGIFFMAFVGHFGEPVGAVSWVPASAIAVLQLGGPVGSALSARLGARPVVMAGGVLAGLGLILASFATSLIQLHLSIGLLTGLGWALVFTPSVAMVAQYFRRRRALAMGLALSGAGLSAFAFSPLFQLLAEAYGWRGALLLVGGLSFHLVACGALLRPLALPISPSTVPSGLLRSSAFLRYAAAFMLVDAGYYVPYVHLVPHARARGCADYCAASVASTASVADLCGRVVAGWLADRWAAGLLRQLALWTALTGTTLALLPLPGSCPGLAAAAAAYGFIAGAVAPLQYAGLAQVVGTGQVLGAVGWMQMAESAGSLVGAPLAGNSSHCPT